MDASQAGSRGAAGPSKPITPASSNQAALDPEEEELFANSQPKVRLQEHSPDPMVGVGIFNKPDSQLLSGFLTVPKTLAWLASPLLSLTSLMQ